MTVITTIITLILGYLGTVVMEDRRARRDMVAAAPATENVKDSRVPCAPR